MCAFPPDKQSSKRPIITETLIQVATYTGRLPPRLQADKILSRPVCQIADKSVRRSARQTTSPTSSQQVVCAERQSSRAVRVQASGAAASKPGRLKRVSGGGPRRRQASIYRGEEENDDFAYDDLRQLPCVFLLWKATDAATHSETIIKRDYI